MARIPASEFRNGIVMQCGCTAPGTLQRPGEPAYVGCGLHSCVDVAEAEPDLTGRTAVCLYGGGKPVPSSPTLAFFRHRPDQPHDEYYCGCWGWD